MFFAYLNKYMNICDIMQPSKSRAMLKEERQQYILNRINQDYRIYLTTISKELGVSDDTVRRDLSELDERGLITKVHGGAIAKSDIPSNFVDRLSTGIPEKQHLARKAITMLKENDVILIDGGTSNLEFVRQLSADMRLTVYTNSFPIANELFDRPNISVFFLGGAVYPESRITVGVYVYQTLQNVYPDWSIVGISNVHPVKGLTIPNQEEAILKRFMMERAKQRLILADNYKLNTAETYFVASLRDIDYLVVDDEKKEELKSSWGQYAGKIM